MSGKLILTERKKYGYMIIDMSGDISNNETAALQSYILAHHTKESSVIILNLEKFSNLSDQMQASLVQMARDLSGNGISIFMMNVSEEINSSLIRNRYNNYIKIIRNEEMLMNRKKQQELDNILNISTEE